MGCCGDNTVSPVRSDSFSEHHDDFEGPLRKRSCRDIVFLILFLAYIGFMIAITILAVNSGDAFRVVYGVDSWGNTCDRYNDVIAGANFSGRDMTGLKYSFYFNPAVLRGTGQSVIICTNACPSTVSSVADMQALAGQGTQLCRYDVATSAYHSGQSDGLGSCPILPVEETQSDSGCVRTVQQLKKRFENIKGEAKRKAGEAKRPPTGGGPPPTKPTEAERMFLDMMGDAPSVVGLSGGLESGELDPASDMVYKPTTASAAAEFGIAIAAEPSCSSGLLMSPIPVISLSSLPEPQKLNPCPRPAAGKARKPNNPTGCSDLLYREVLELEKRRIEAELLLAQKCVSDLETAWREIIYLCLIAIALGLAMVILLRFFAGVIIWIMVIALGLGSLIATIFCWYTYGVLRAEVDAKASPTTAEQDEVRNWLIGAICASVIAVIILLVLLVLRSRIALVVQLFKEAGKAIGAIPFLLIQPFWTLLVLSGTVAGLIFVFLYIETASTPSVDSSTGHVSFTLNVDMQYLKWFFILGMLWITQFIVASQELVIASSVAIWFFTRDKSKLRTPIFSSIYRLIRYHLGSVAFGSLIIALVKFARLILSYIEGKLHGNVGCCAAFCLKCLQCCLWCFEKVLKFLNRNAYIIIAIHGYSFCKSARRAFTIIVSNALRLVAINCVGDFVLFLGKVGTVAAVACVGIELFKNRTDIYYIWLPITISCVFAYFIAGCFMDVYEMVIDTVFICFAEDCEMNDGVTRPYFMSVDLMNFVENSRQAIALAERKGQT